MDQRRGLQPGAAVDLAGLADSLYYLYSLSAGHVEDNRENINSKANRASPVKATRRNIPCMLK